MQKRRHESVKEFQKSRTRNLFIANIQAAGVGVTLTKAARYLFVEPSWVPGENDQAIRRLFRITQERKVQGSFLVCKNSLDHLILNAHQRKNKNIDRGIHGR
jgi:SWI/SNF-related matrix-associated actin-dependent regulator 1 of chromatin subfamily A